jgi:hypothetical protein
MHNSSHYEPNVTALGHALHADLPARARLEAAYKLSRSTRDTMPSWEALNTYSCGDCWRVGVLGCGFGAGDGRGNGWRVGWERWDGRGLWHHVENKVLRGFINVFGTRTGRRGGLNSRLFLVDYATHGPARTKFIHEPPLNFLLPSIHIHDSKQSVSFFPRSSLRLLSFRIDASVRFGRHL